MAKLVKHRLLKCKFSGPANRLAEACIRDFRGIDNYVSNEDPRIQRQWDVRSAINAVALVHLGLDINKPVTYFVDQGFDVVVQYFSEPWWKDNVGARGALNKRGKPGTQYWFRTFSWGILLGLLAGRWEDIERVCDWVEAKLKAEYLGDEVEDELVDVYKCIAAGLRQQPMRGLNAVQSRIGKCRTLRPKLLFECFEAALKNDQDGFSTSLIKSLEHFDANFGVGPTPIEWVAADQSVVALAARHFGMVIPALPPRLQARLITPDTLGLRKTKSAKKSVK